MPNANEEVLNQENKRFLDYEGIDYVVKALRAELGKKLETIPVATRAAAGAVKVGNGINIDNEGTISVDIDVVDTAVADLAAQTEEHFETVEQNFNDAINSLRDEMGNVYHFKGSVADMAALNAIADPAVGDVYNVEDDGEGHTGMNYGYTSDGTWDSLGATSIDLSDYVKDEDIQAITIPELDVILGLAANIDAIKAILAQDKADLSIAFQNEMELDEPLVIGAGKTVTVDLNGQTVNTTQALFTVDGGTLVLKGNGNVIAAGNIANAINGGTVIVNGGNYNSNASNYGFASIGSGAKVIFNNGYLQTQEAGLMAFDGGSITMNGGTLEGRDNFAIATNGSRGRGGNTITVNGGTIIGNIQSANYEACGIYLPNDDTFVMNDGTIIAHGGCGILIRGGSATINGGSITTEMGDHVPGWVGDNKTKMSASGIIFHETANYPAKDSMSLYVSDNVVINAANEKIELLRDTDKDNVNIPGMRPNP